MPNEDAMSFDYNTITKQVAVVFKGKKSKLSGVYKDWSRAKEAAEDFCRKNGWQG